MGIDLGRSTSWLVQRCFNPQKWLFHIISLKPHWIFVSLLNFVLYVLKNCILIAGLNVLQNSCLYSTVFIGFQDRMDALIEGWLRRRGTRCTTLHFFPCRLKRICTGHLVIVIFLVFCCSWFPKWKRGLRFLSNLWKIMHHWFDFSNWSTEFFISFRSIELF